jgi:hypothetical protein
MKDGHASPSANSAATSMTSANPAPWLVMIAAGALLTVAGLVRLRRPA